MRIDYICYVCGERILNNNFVMKRKPISICGTNNSKDLVPVCKRCNIKENFNFSKKFIDSYRKLYL